MATRQEKIIRTKQIIQSQPTLGKYKINSILKSEFGSGLRNSEILSVKGEVSHENPELMPYLYSRGGVSQPLNAIYRGWVEAGFLPFEARELTIGHDTPFDTKSVFISKPAILARQSRIEWLRMLVDMGWNRKQIRQAIIDYYIKGKKKSPWDFIRAEYRDKKKIDFVDYKKKAQRRAKLKINRLYKG